MSRSAIVLLAVLLGVGSPCVSLGQHNYSVELSKKPFEVRRYKPTIAATVHVNGDRSNAVTTGFCILAGYIFGDNQAHAKIAMSAPVIQSADNTILTIATTTLKLANSFDINL